MRLDPQMLRDAREASASTAEPTSGEGLMIAILLASEGLRERQARSFRESMSDYNPLGQFFAAHQRDA
jgi:hypothetical protein